MYSLFFFKLHIYIYFNACLKQFFVLIECLLNHKSWLALHTYSVVVWLLPRDILKNDGPLSFCPVAGLLQRPLEITNTSELKIRMFEFLVCINAVKNPGKIASIGSHSLRPIDLVQHAENSNIQSFPTDSFNTDQISALETALELLENINSRFDISTQDYITACTPLQELVCISVLALWLLDVFNLFELDFFPPVRSSDQRYIVTIRT